MSLLQQAVELNNLGIAALQHGDKSSSIENIMKSLKLLKTALTNGNVTTSSSPVTPPVMTSRLDEIYAVSIPSALSRPSDETPLFNEAFQLPTNLSTSPFSEFEAGVYSSAIMFNLALAHQSVGERTFLDKAQKLYEMVINLLEDSIFLSMRSTLLVKLGCFNNLSQVQRLKGDLEETSTRQRMSELSFNLLDQSPAQKEILQEKEIRVLLLNLLLIKLPTVAAAA